MNFITLTTENLPAEHICCAISKADDCQIASKKAWLSERLQEGLVFLKADVRGKCFIEYIPAEYAWAPIEAPGYMYIDCLWVSGQLKGQGYSTRLLEECIRDSRDKGKEGLVILTSDKKRSFLADRKFLLHKGFRPADKLAPYFELFYLPFHEEAILPQFKRNAFTETEDGFILYYTRQCPFTAKYVPILENYAKEKQIPFRSILIDTCEKAQRAPIPFTTFALFYKGNFVTHEIVSINKFEKIIQELL